MESDRRGGMTGGEVSGWRVTGEGVAGGEVLEGGVTGDSCSPAR